ncbi:MAG TPA: DUF721 domain-containing protein [Chthoniobacterales bacterium]
MKRSFRSFVLSEWRGLPQPDGEPDRCVPISEVLKQILPKLGLKDRLDEQEIQDAWHEIVGDFLANHAKPSGLKHGVLLIQVIQASVRYELETVWKAKILLRLQERFGAKKIREVKFR